MKNYRLCFLFFFLLIFNSYSQQDKVQINAGASVLPIVDLFKIFPNNKIYGEGVTVTAGFFPLKNLNVGLNPYGVFVRNEYPVYSGRNGLYQQAEDLKLIGVNIYARYYFSKGKFRFYPSLAAGFGEITTRTYKVADNTQLSLVDAPIFSLMAGGGISYLVTKKLAVELNIPFTLINSLEDDYHQHIGFQTIAPTVGVQYYFR